MGMESYYYALKMNTNLSCMDLVDLLRRHYRVRPYTTVSRKERTIINQERFSLANRAIIGFQQLSGTVQITFEVCFTNYVSNIVYLFEVALLLMNFGSLELVLFEEAYPLSPSDFDLFCNKLRYSHKAKYNMFVKKYGENIKFCCLPNDFYRKRLFRSLRLQSLLLRRD